MNLLPRLAYRLWGPQIAHAIASNAMRPKGFDGMSYAFTDHDGKLYYSWPKAENMPPTRLLKVEGCMVQIDHGSGKATNEKFANAILDVCNAMVTVKTLKEAQKESGKVILLANDLLVRRTRLIPEETYFELAALCAVREDEDPWVFDPTIHVQKVEAFRKAAPQDPFFLASPAFKAVLGHSLTTVEGCMLLLSNWIHQNQREEAMLKVCSPQGA